MKILLLMMAMLVAGCSQVPMLPSLTPYKIDVQQGNVVTQDMLSKLKLGMTRSQVRFALGTPLIIDPFRDNRWDYAYMMHKAGNLVEQRVITMIFDGDKLARIDGDVVPGSAAAAQPPVDKKATESKATKATKATDTKSPETNSVGAKAVGAKAVEKK